MSTTCHHILLHLCATQSNPLVFEECNSVVTVIFPNTTHAIMVISIIHSWFSHPICKTFISLPPTLSVEWEEDKALNNVCWWYEDANPSNAGKQQSFPQIKLREEAKPSRSESVDAESMSHSFSTQRTEAWQCISMLNSFQPDTVESTSLCTSVSTKGPFYI